MYNEQPEERFHNHWVGTNVFFFFFFFPMTSYSVNGHFYIPHRDNFMVQHTVKELFK